MRMCSSWADWHWQHLCWLLVKESHSNLTSLFSHVSSFVPFSFFIFKLFSLHFWFSPNQLLCPSSASGSSFSTTPDTKHFYCKSDLKHRRKVLHHHPITSILLFLGDDTWWRPHTNRAALCKIIILNVPWKMSPCVCSLSGPSHTLLLLSSYLLSPSLPALIRLLT